MWALRGSIDLSGSLKDQDDSRGRFFVLEPSYQYLQQSFSLTPATNPKGPRYCYGGYFP